MKYVGLSEARANFDQLCDEVERGVTVIITRGGPPERPARQTDAANKEKWRQAMRDLRDLKKGAGLATVDEILKWREEVRKDASLR
jgi:prevent-host-death family protein